MWHPARTNPLDHTDTDHTTPFGDVWKWTQPMSGPPGFAVYVNGQCRAQGVSNFTLCYWLNTAEMPTPADAA